MSSDENVTGTSPFVDTILLPCWCLLCHFYIYILPTILCIAFYRERGICFSLCVYLSVSVCVWKRREEGRRGFCFVGGGGGVGRYSNVFLHMRLEEAITVFEAHIAASKS